MAKRTLVLVSAALTACGVLSRAAWAADQSNSSNSGDATAQAAVHNPVYADAAGVSATGPAPQPQAEQRPLMELLAPTPVGSALQQARINVFGYMEGSYEYNFDHPKAQPINGDRLLDLFQNNIGYLNQVDLTIERKVDLDSHQFDIGGRIENVFGQDARFIHSNGLLDHQGGNPNVLPPIIGGKYQYDLYQAYADFGIPLGDGLRVRVGKFSFFKPIDPNASIFYTHTIAFAETFPYTNTGVTAMYRLGNTLSIEGGISRGWDQSLKDNNGSIDGLGRVMWKPSESQRVIASIIVGPELPRDDSDYTTLFDLTYKQAFGDNFAVFFDGLFGHQVHPTSFGGPGIVAVPTTPNTFPPTAASWYGVSGNAIYSLNRYVDLAARGEWYRDEEGYTTGLQGNYYEATIGATAYPLASTSIGRNFQLRPEVRWDHSDHAYFDNILVPTSTGATAPVAQKHNQVTFAIDAIFNF